MTDIDSNVGPEGLVSENPNRPPRRPAYLRPALLVLFAFIVILGLGLVIVLGQWFSPMAGGRLDGSVVVVDRGDSPKQLGNKLSELGLIDGPLLFEIYVRLSGAAASIQAGSYELGPRTSIADFVQMTVGGASISDDITVTIVEGLTVPQQGAIFENAGLFSAASFEAAAVMSDYFENFWILDELEDGTSLIGYLYPDTYRFRPDTLPQRAIQRMLSRAQQQFETIGISSTGKVLGRMHGLHQILTFASIVQSETPTGDEALIAGVFYNRLQNGWRFESDATVNFILGTSKLIPSSTDIRVVDPYNTYLITGLPPGPINSPGLDVIQASLAPQKHEWFFFLHTPEGITVPSRTFEEHLRNRAKYWE